MVKLPNAADLFPQGGLRRSCAEFTIKISGLHMASPAQMMENSILFPKSGKANGLSWSLSQFSVDQISKDGELTNNGGVSWAYKTYRLLGGSSKNSMMG
jgi:hypothetical protein